MLQRGAFHKFHRNESLTVVFADFMDGANIWMVQSGSSLCLTVEAAQSLRVRRETIGKELQGYEAVQLDIFRFINHAHPTTAQLPQNAVVRDGLTNHDKGGALADEC